MKKQWTSIKDLVNKGIKKSTIQLALDISLFELELNINNRLSKTQIDFIYTINNAILNNQDITFLLEYKYFYNIKLKIQRGIFVPQYDTEIMIEEAIKLIKYNEYKNGLEIGFGTGAISICLCKNTNIKMDAIDNNESAFEIANINKKLNSIANCKFEVNDLFKFKNDTKYDLIISNPPYIDLEDKFVSDWVYQNQPHSALFSNNNGLEHIEKIIALSSKILNNNGTLIFEFGFQQKHYVENLLKENLWEYNFKKDLGNNWRYVVAKRKNDESK